jgi:hypothetical protein
MLSKKSDEVDGRIDRPSLPLFSCLPPQAEGKRGGKDAVSVGDRDDGDDEVVPVPAMTTPVMMAVPVFGSGGGRLIRALGRGRCGGLRLRKRRRRQDSNRERGCGQQHFQHESPRRFSLQVFAPAVFAPGHECGLNAPVRRALSIHAD